MSLLSSSETKPLYSVKYSFMKHSATSQACSDIPSCGGLPFKGTAKSLLCSSQQRIHFWRYPDVWWVRAGCAKSYWRWSQIFLWLPAGLWLRNVPNSHNSGLFHGTLKGELSSGWPHKLLSHKHFSSASPEVVLISEATCFDMAERAACFVWYN